MPEPLGAVPEALAAAAVDRPAFLDGAPARGEVPCVAAAFDDEPAVDRSAFAGNVLAFPPVAERVAEDGATASDSPVGSGIAPKPEAAVASSSSVETVGRGAAEPPALGLLAFFVREADCFFAEAVPFEPAPPASLPESAAAKPAAAVGSSGLSTEIPAAAAGFFEAAPSAEAAPGCFPAASDAEAAVIPAAAVGSGSTIGVRRPALFDAEFADVCSVAAPVEHWADERDVSPGVELAVCGCCALETPDAAASSRALFDGMA
ncbi:hypothetical protein [Nocardia brasiliensis]|uniref:hypothetical protein n=1 Tax=Nocardia brasiliensis TaxID=37326 RepID=UPI002453CAC5|nr:hypothetical protein [Nocardia brasiliensis]